MTYDTPPEFDTIGVVRRPIEKKQVCLFSNNNCKHFVNGEHRCFIFKQKCELMPKMIWGINQFNELVELSFIIEQV